jgi:hypothetical protein
MIVLILLIVACTVFALIGLYRSFAPPREDWPFGALALALAAVAAALAFWHAGH